MQKVRICNIMTFFLFKNKERAYSFLILIFLLAITFAPLILRKNFIPFEKYPQWSFMLAKSSDQQLQVSPAVKKFITMPWAEDAEFGSLGINWTGDLYFAHMLKQWKLPLWDPYIGGGVPTLDNGQSRPFNPLRLLFYLFPTSWVYSLTLLFGMVFGGVGAYLYLSKRELSPAAVTLGTGIFMLNPWVLDRLVLTDSAAYLILPWCLLTLEQTRWGDWSSIGRAVLCFALMGHSGHPVVSIIIAVAAASCYLFSKERWRKDQEDFGVRIKIIVVVAGLTLACLAVIWLPLLKLLSVGFLYKKHGWFTTEYSWKSVTMLPSDMFVAPAVGVILICALLAWERLPKVWLTLLAATSLILLFPTWGVIKLSRILSQMGIPALYLKGVFWASLSFLLPYGMDAYQTSRERIALVIKFLVGGAMLALAGWQFAICPMEKQDISVFPITAFLLLGSGLPILVAFKAVKGKMSPLLMSGIILVPLAFPLSLNKLSWNTIDFKTNSVVEWLKANQPEARVVSVDPRLILAIPPNFGQAYSVRCVEVACAIFLNNYSLFRHPRGMATAVLFDSLFVEVFGQMGATIVLLPNEASSLGLPVLIKGPLFSAYSIPRMHGRLYFAEQVRPYDSHIPFPNQIQSINQNTDAVAVVEDMGNPVPQKIPEIFSGEGKALFEQDEIHKVIIRTESPSEGLLVLRDSWYPGWIAFIDGEKTPILRINGCFRGVIVPAGEHKIRFSYRPILVYASGAVSLLTVLLVVIVSLRKSFKLRQLE